jgi:hypothetical protein
MRGTGEFERKKYLRGSSSDLVSINEIIEKNTPKDSKMRSLVIVINSLKDKTFLVWLNCVITFAIYPGVVLSSTIL